HRPRCPGRDRHRQYRLHHPARGRRRHPGGPHGRVARLGDRRAAAGGTGHHRSGAFYRVTSPGIRARTRPLPARSVRAAMTKPKTKPQRPEARVPKGLRDTTAREVRAMEHMLAAIRAVYESYGFEPLETPAIEYTDALGKFLPDLDRPNEGVFSFQDDDEQWLSLRYDLTAPLARYVAENFEQLPKPFRRYQAGPVWRNEKAGPGRFRQFTQFDADTVGSALPAADAEITMMAADCLERVGIARGSYVMRVNNRKVRDGGLETIGVAWQADGEDERRLTVMRAVDKLDRLGTDGVRLLLGEGRKDESGDFTRGAGLAPSEADRIIAFVSAGAEDRETVLANLGPLVGDSAIGREGIDELAQMSALFDAAGYGPDRIRIDPSVVRGLGYY